MAKEATEFPINFGYGRKLFPFYGSISEDGYSGTVAPAHHGDDRAQPTGGIVRVCGTIIGYTGATGTVTGSHLHNDKYKAGRHPGGVYVSSANRTYFPPASGFFTPGTVTFAGNAGTAGNMVTIKGTDGFYYRFLHLSKISVKVGQVIRGSKLMLSETRARRLFKDTRGRLPSAAELKVLMATEVTGEWNIMYDKQYNHSGAVEYRRKKSEAGL